jgi:branched-chain amino acid transport system ATP-binding protein
MLELIDVHSYYGETHVLYGISLNVGEHSVVALLGRNGMGKTTTLRAIIGFTPPRCGVIRFAGKDICGLQPDQIARLGIGLVPQGRRIFPSLSVEENLSMAARNQGKPENELWTLDRVYSMFPILAQRANLRGTMLSGGEQQMLTICRALMTNPDLLLLDEPSEGLAPIIVRDIRKVISQLKVKGLSVLLVEQNLALALAVSDYAYVVSKGNIVHSSTPAELERNEGIKNSYLGVSK